MGLIIIFILANYWINGVRSSYWPYSWSFSYFANLTNTFLIPSGLNSRWLGPSVPAIACAKP